MDLIKISSSLMRCSNCSGRKILAGLGMMNVDCPACNGIGYIDKDSVKNTNPIDKDINNNETINAPIKDTVNEQANHIDPTMVADNDSPITSKSVLKRMAGRPKKK